MSFLVTHDGACRVDQCIKPAARKGLCGSHYKRLWRYGDPLAGRSTFKGEPKAFLEKRALTHDGDECLTWPFAKDGKGYAQIHDAGASQQVSILVCERIYGPRPSDRHQAAHSCGKGHLACCGKNHVSWKTREENEADKIRHGTDSRGERHPNAVLTKADVVAIRYAAGKQSQRSVAKQFGISAGHVSDIQRRKKWAEFVVAAS